MSLVLVHIHVCVLILALQPSIRLFVLHNPALGQLYSFIPITMETMGCLDEKPNICQGYGPLAMILRHLRINYHIDTSFEICYWLALQMKNLNLHWEVLKAWIHVTLKSSMYDCFLCMYVSVANPEGFPRKPLLKACLVLLWLTTRCEWAISSSNRY